MPYGIDKLLEMVYLGILVTFNSFYVSPALSLAAKVKLHGFVVVVLERLNMLGLGEVEVALADPPYHILKVCGSGDSPEERPGGHVEVSRRRRDETSTQFKSLGNHFIS